MLRSDKFLSLLKRMHFILSSPKWTDSLLSTNQSHTFANSLFETFSISVTSLFNYEYLTKPVEYHLMYTKNNKSYNMDSWGTPQFMVPAFKNTVQQKKLYLYEWNLFLVLSEEPMHFIFFNKILWSYSYVLHFQHRLKSCQLIETNMYL